MTFATQKWIKPRKLTLVVVGVLLGLAALYLAYTQYGLYLANQFTPISSNTTNLNAFYIGIGQGRTLFVRLELVAGSEDNFLSELCENRYTRIDEHTNPFQDMKSGWIPMPYWWTPPTEAEAYLGGECYDSAIYNILIDQTDTAAYTAYIKVGF